MPISLQKSLFHILINFLKPGDLCVGLILNVNIKSKIETASKDMNIPGIRALFETLFGQAITQSLSIFNDYWNFNVLSLTGNGRIVSEKLNKLLGNLKYNLKCDIWKKTNFET